jgi:hypothetical protein
MSSLKFTVADALALGSATLIAVTETVAGAGRTTGAIYSPAAVIVPTTAFPPGTLFTFQVTLVFVAPVTFAWNCCFCPRNRFALAGCMVTTTAEGPGEDELVDPQPGSISAFAQKSARKKNESLERVRKRITNVLLVGNVWEQSCSWNDFIRADT